MTDYRFYIVGALGAASTALSQLPYEWARITAGACSGMITAIMGYYGFKNRTTK